jgi:hypothetical protein
MSATVWLAENSKDTLEAEVNPEDVEEDRSKRESEDQKVAAEAAEKLLNDASKRKYPVHKKTSQWNMNKEERSLMKKILCNKMEKDIEDYKGEAWT